MPVKQKGGFSSCEDFSIDCIKQEPDGFSLANLSASWKISICLKQHISKKLPGLGYYCCVLGTRVTVKQGGITETCKYVWKIYLPAWWWKDPDLINPSIFIACLNQCVAVFLLCGV